MSMNVFYSLTGLLKPKYNQEIRQFYPLILAIGQLTRTTAAV